MVGFFGGIHDWFDAPLVTSLAKLRPTWDIWLAGDTYRAQVEPLRSLASVTFFGEVPYGELPRLVGFFDVGIIPFRITPLTEATNPVKVYEMLAAGLPVVAVDLPELRALRPWVSLASTAEEFAARIEDALTEAAEARLQRRQFALRHSWVERFLEFQGAMDEAADRPARAAVPSPVTLASLGISKLELEKLDLQGRIASLQADLEAGRQERNRLVHTAAGLDAERISLVEQRERVQAEAERLDGELNRLETERLLLEGQLQRIRSSLWWRLGSRLRLARPLSQT